MSSCHSNTNSAFTIVELLVVIVVIGILAAITIVSYTGISQKAIITTLQSDLSNGASQLRLYLAVNNSYPTALNINNCPTAPVVDNNLCLKLSSNNKLTYSSNGTTFGLTVSNGTLSNNISQAGTILSGGSNLFPLFPTNNVYNWTSTGYYSEIYPNVPIKPSTTYTFSYSYSVTSGTLSNLRIGVGGGSLNSYQVDYISWTTALLSTGKFTFTTPATLVFPYFQLRPVLDVANAGESKNVNLWNIKLEEGNYATPWTPSP